MRARPVRRSAILRVVVTALAVGLLVYAWEWVQRGGGPERALVFLYGVLVALFAAIVLVWAWKRHPY